MFIIKNDLLGWILNRFINTFDYKNNTIPVNDISLPILSGADNLRKDYVWCILCMPII